MSYPHFLSLQSTLSLHFSAAYHGFVDACRWDIVFSIVTQDTQIRANVYKSLVLNTLCLLSVYTFDFILLLVLPHGPDQQNWLYRNIGWFYNVLWLLPVIGVSFYLNSTWSSAIAKRTFTLQHGSRSRQLQPQPVPLSYSTILASIATSAYRGIMVFSSLVLSFALSALPVPYVGSIAGFMFLCWVDSYYCFEFVWMAKGLSLTRRVRHLEEHWAYYFAFGFPPTLVCTFSSSLASAAIFALVFPSYIIMATNAHPLPLDPYNPSSSSRTEDQDVVYYPSPFVPIRLPVFAPVLWLNDQIINILDILGGGRRKSKRTTSVDIDAHEKLEGGDGIQLQRVSERPASGRQRIVLNTAGNRRKFD